MQLPMLGILRDPSIEVSSLLGSPIHSLITSSSQVTISAEYFTSKRPNTRRTLRRTISHPVALPLAVNVQDFFRKDWYAL